MEPVTAGKKITAMAISRATTVDDILDAPMMAKSASHGDLGGNHTATVFGEEAFSESQQARRRAEKNLQMGSRSHRLK